MNTNLETDILIVGGGLGGCAAAMAATDMGCRVILSEPTRWLGGQLTSQAVPPDEHSWMERVGCTARYRRLRDGIRAYYRKGYPLLPAAMQDPTFNPGCATVSNLCHEPRVALAVIEQMLAFARTSSRLRVLLQHRPVAAGVDRDRIHCVTLHNEESGSQVTVTAQYILDATELGDILSLANVEYISGAESAYDTGELHAVPGPPQPGNVQALTWCFPLAHDPSPDANHTITPPSQYARWKSYIPNLSPPWAGPLLSFDGIHPITMKARQFELFGDATKGDFSSLWHYRRIVAAQHYAPSDQPHEITLVNWPQNDYLVGNIIDAPPDQVAVYLEEARQLSLSLVYWLQTEAPRPDDGRGYPGLYLVPEITGTSDGLAQAPYIREGRRIRAESTVTENQVGSEAREGQAAEFFADSVGIGYYRIDLHPSTAGDNYIDVAAMPFQIPLGSLIPVRLQNLLPACKNIGTTHISNGCYRLHPVEWNIGEAAGSLAAFCIQRELPPRGVWERKKHLAAFQDVLRQHGFELNWPDRIIDEAINRYAEELQDISNGEGLVESAPPRSRKPKS